MSDYGPIERELRRQHLAEYIRDFGEPIREDQALCQRDFETSYRKFWIRQPSKVFWRVWFERWYLWLTTW